jgi:16S rRNA (cytosine967-C5)-methyltransferase
LTRPLGGLDPAVRAALRIGAWELLFGDTPEHAAVDQAVEVSRALGSGPASGLVNAVLRKARIPARVDEADAADLPAWLFERWVRRYGLDATRAWAESLARRPALFVVLRDPDRWPAGLVGQPQELPGVVRVDGWKGPVSALPGFSDGLLWVADRSAVAVADLVPVAGRVLDAAAAPGGKCFRLASRGAQVTAVDRDDERLHRLAEGADRLGLTPRIARHDWTHGPLPGRPTFDAVLLDAPCTGLGTLRRHPEIKWRRMEPDVHRAAVEQRALLETVSTHVRPGGWLVYSVCSSEPEEGVDVVRSFLSSHADFAMTASLDTAPALDGSDAHVGFQLRRSA